MSWQMIPWEVYDTRSPAVAALSDAGTGGTDPLPPIVDYPLVQWEDVWPVTCVLCDGESWQNSAVEAQPQLRSLAERFGRRRVVLDFLGRPIGRNGWGWPMGSALVGCIYALYWGVAGTGGRFAACGLTPDMREFFQWHKDPIAVPRDPGWFLCLVHNRPFQEHCPACSDRHERRQETR